MGTGNPAVRLEPAGRGDLPAIEGMARETWWNHFPGIISDGQILYMLSRLYSLNRMTAELEAGQAEYRFVCHEGERVGFCSFGMVENRTAMKIHKLYILPGYQKRGFGSGALRCIEALGRERGARVLVLAVNRKNEAAVHLYEREGFVIRKPVVVDIGGGFVMDDYVMEKSLT